MLLASILMMNLLTFILMGVDKRRAQKGRWRVPEKTLFLTAAFFGALGGVAGMRVFRHKTKKWVFRIGFPALLLMQLGLLAAYCVYIRH